MPHTRTWDSTVPPDNQAVSQGAQRIREFRVDVAERMTIDHVWSDGVNTDGYHKKTTFTNQSNPTQLADAIILFAKDASAVSELHAVKENGTIIQITSGGGLNDSSIGDTAATVNKVVRRDATGHAFAVNFNSSAANDTSGPFSQIVYRNGSDGYYRAASIANVHRTAILTHTIASDPGGTPSLAAGQMAMYY